MYGTLLAGPCQGVSLPPYGTVRQALLLRGLAAQSYLLVVVIQGVRICQLV